MPGRKAYDAQEQYILDNISNEGYSDKALPFIEDKLTFLRETFLAEYGWHVKQVGEFKALSSWLAGLPSAISIAFYSHDILRIGEQWGLIKADASEAKQHIFLNSWFDRMAMRIQTLWKRHKITFN